MIRNKRREVLLLVCVDTFIIIGSMLVAWSIRREFKYFFFDIDNLYYFLPLVVICRLLVGSIFEHYKSGVRYFGARDLLALISENTIASGILLSARLISPIATLRMPISMIIIEYLFTTIFMASIRSLVSQGDKRLYDANMKPLSALFFTANAADFVGRIMTPNPSWQFCGVFSRERLDWNLEMEGIRVFGGIESFTTGFLVQHPTQAIWGDYSLDRRERTLLRTMATKHGLILLFSGKNSSPRPATIYDFIEDSEDPRAYIPEGVCLALANVALDIWGGECLAAKYSLLPALNAMGLSPRVIGLMEPPSEEQRRWVIDLRPLAAAELGLFCDFACSKYMDFSTILQVRPLRQILEQDLLDVGGKNVLFLPKSIGPNPIYSDQYMDPFCSVLIAGASIAKALVLAIELGKQVVFIGGIASAYEIKNPLQYDFKPYVVPAEQIAEFEATSFYGLMYRSGRAW